MVAQGPLPLRLDWGPRFVTSGIWRDARLEVWDGARLDDLQVFQDRLDASAATLTIKARVIGGRAGRYRLTVTADGGAPIAEADVNVEVGPNVVTLGARIDKPELWWPNGLGPQRIYVLDDAAGGGGPPSTHARRGSACGRWRWCTSATSWGRASSSR